MTDLTFVDAFLIIFIGMGPLKVLLVFISLTEGLDSEVRRAVARRTVLVAGSVGMVLLLFGAFFQKVLHFSTGALAIAGGLILLILALNMVLAKQGGPSEGGKPQDPMSLAVSPLGLPLTLNPVGIVALVVFSGESQSLSTLAAIAVMIVLVAAIDLAILLSSDRIAKHLTHHTVELMERVLGILLGALAVQLILDGLASLGVITMTAH